MRRPGQGWKSEFCVPSGSSILPLPLVAFDKGLAMALRLVFHPVGRNNDSFRHGRTAFRRARWIG